MQAHILADTTHGLASSVELICPCATLVMRPWYHNNDLHLLVLMRGPDLQAKLAGELPRQAMAGHHLQIRPAHSASQSRRCPDPAVA